MKIINLNDNLRVQTANKLTAEGLSLRQAQELSGVSYATLSRFIRGGEVQSRVYDQLSSWINGVPSVKKKQIQSRRFKVGAKIFLVTIEELINKEQSKREGEG